MKHVVRKIAHWGLLVHIYISMAGFTLALLFAVTGLTLNHQDFGWSEPRVVTSSITIDENLVSNPNQAALETLIREKLGLRSPATDYHEDPDEIQITFAAPGKRTLVTINRADGSGTVEMEQRGFLAKLDDLHKGSDTGRVWYWTIDVAALFLVVSSLTGMVTLLALRTRRRGGFLVGALGILMVIMLYVIWVPK
jgi:uncharacterized protein